MIHNAILKKAHAVSAESDRQLFSYFHVLPSRRRYRCIKCKTAAYSTSFVTVAIRMLNKWYWFQRVYFFVWLHFEFRLYFVTIYYLHILDAIMSCTMHIVFKDIQVNWIEEKS